MGMVAILINRQWPFEQIFIPPLTDGSTWSLKKIGPGVTEKKLFKGVDRWTINNDGPQVITIAHPEPCSGELKKNCLRFIIKYYSLTSSLPPDKMCVQNGRQRWEMGGGGGGSEAGVNNTEVYMPNKVSCFVFLSMLVHFLPEFNKTCLSH